METAIAYNQSDIYKIAERRAFGVRPLFEELENFDFNMGEDPQEIENFVSRCGRALDLLATVMTHIAAAGTSLDDSTIAWLLELSRTIDRNILANPAFDSISPERATEIERHADDLAYALSIIDLNNSRTIKEVLGRRGFADHA